MGEIRTVVVSTVASDTALTLTEMFMGNTGPDKVVTKIVSSVGSDDNDGLTALTGFATLEKAVSMIPNTVVGIYTVNVYSVTDTTTINLSSKEGSGLIIFTFTPGYTANPALSISSLTDMRCDVSILSMLCNNLTVTKSKKVDILDSTIKSLVFNSSTGLVSDNTFDSAGAVMSILAYNFSTIYSANNVNVPDSIASYGLRAESGSTIIKVNGQPTGLVENEAITSGGLIR